MTSWLLPESISDVLPDEARRVEELRRALLDLFRGYGYELVMPPLLEHLDSLLTGSGHDLDLRTFKLVDQLSGRTLGLRADTTPQVARIDAHILNRAGIVRLCYAATVVHARPAHPLATREPIQVGAELYGDGSIEADAEIAQLALRALQRCGATQIQMDLGHTGVLRALLAGEPAAAAPAGAAGSAAAAGAGAGVTDAILTALNTKDGAALDAALAPLSAAGASAIRALARLHGGAEVIRRARRELPAQPAIGAALDDLDRLATELAGSSADQPGPGTAVEVSVDLADLHGYRYHTGLTFAAYTAGRIGQVLRGGRYDEIGRAFGRARAATGFSIVDLRELAALRPADAPAAIRAPRGTDAALLDLMRTLRNGGQIVVVDSGAVPERCAGGGFRFDREIRKIEGSWRVVAVESGMPALPAASQPA